MLRRRVLLPLLLALASLPCAAVHAQVAPALPVPAAAPLPASLFFAPRSLGGATLSPDGRSWRCASCRPANGSGCA